MNLEQWQSWALDDKNRAQERIRLTQAQPQGNGFAFSAKSLRRLSGVHPDLQRVFHTAIKITEVDFSIFEGLRSLKRQKYLVANNRSWTMNSRHLHGLAVDAVPWIDKKITWKLGPILKLAPFIIRAAEIENVPLRWGGDWNSNGRWQDEQKFDGAHYELPRAQYPDP